MFTIYRARGGGRGTQTKSSYSIIDKLAFHIGQICANILTQFELLLKKTILRLASFFRFQKFTNLKYFCNIFLKYELNNKLLIFKK